MINKGKTTTAANGSNHIRSDEYSLFEQCPESQCKKGPIIADESTGDVICGTCGLVLVEKSTDMREEWNNFEGKQDKTRVGAKTSLVIHDMGLSTAIKPVNKDAGGNRLSFEASRQFRRLRIWDNRSKTSSRERSLRTAFVILDGMADKLALPDIVSETAAYYYRKIKSRNAKTGKSTAALVSAALYAACRFTHTPRTLQDIAKVSNIKKKSLQKTYRDLVKQLDLQFPSYDPVAFVTGLSSRIKASEQSRRLAIKILEEAERKMLLTGKNPMGMAAGALYIACINNLENIPQAVIAKESGISSVTIRHSCMSLKKIKF